MTDPKRIQGFCIATAVLVLGIFVAAYWDPVSFWGVNFHTYLPNWLPPLVVALWVAVGMGITYLKANSLKKVPHWVWAGALALLAGVLFAAFPIQTDLYGDSRIMLKELGPGGQGAKHYSLIGALSPNILSSKNGEQFTYSLVLGLAQLTGAKVLSVFHALAAVTGAIWVFAWIWFVLHKLQARALRVLGVALGLSAGIVQVFFGHVEVYAAPVLAFTLYLMALVEWLDGRKRGWFVALTLLLLLAIRTHSAGFALLPTYLYAMAAWWTGRDANRETWLGWRRLGWMLPAISVLLAITAYFGLFHGGHELQPITPATHSPFLTLTGDETADNAYAMLSGWHVWDFGQEILLWSAMGCALLLVWVPYRLRKGAWDAPAEIGVSLALILLAGLIFAIDPLLTMPRDWDLCGLGAPALLIFGVLMLRRLPANAFSAWFSLPALVAVGGLQCCAFILNQQGKALNMRLIDLGTEAFHSSHSGSSFIVKNALFAPDFKEQEQHDILDRTLRDWETHRTPRNQPEYSFLCRSMGELKFKQKDFDAAAKYYTLSALGAPGDVAIQEDIATAYASAGNWPEALKATMKALEMQSQKPQSWEIAYIAARETKQFDLALRMALDFKSRFGDVNGIGLEIANLERIIDQQKAAGLP